METIVSYGSFWGEKKKKGKKKAIPNSITNNITLPDVSCNTPAIHCYFVYEKKHQQNTDKNEFNKFISYRYVF